MKRKKSPDNNLSFGVWEHHLKDVELPIINKDSLYSSVQLKPLESINIKYSDKLVLNIENCHSNFQWKEKIGFYQINDKKYDLISGLNIGHLFSEFMNIKSMNEQVFYSWYHKPLISGSINYLGSYYGHQAKIYKIKILKEDPNGIILIKNTSKNCSIRIWI